MPKSAFKRKIKNNTPVSYGGIATGISLFTNNDARINDLYIAAYANSPSLFSNVNLLAETTSFADWRLYRSVSIDGRVRYTTGDLGSDMRTEVVQHQALKVLQSPNPFMTQMDLFEISQTYLDLCGESWWVITKNNNIPVGIWPVRPSRMTVVPDPANYIKGYYYTDDNGDKTALLPEDVVYVKYNNPSDYYRGHSPVKSVLTDIEASKWAAEWNRNFFINSANPGGIIQIDKRLSDDEWNEMINRFRESNRGVSRAHRVATLEQGATWIPNGTNQKDMDFVNLRVQSRDFIHENYRTNKVMLGISDDVNRANAQTGQEVFSAWQIIPRLTRWRNSLNAQFLPMFGVTGQGVEFDFEPPIPSSREEANAELVSKANALQKLVDSGMNPHDALEIVGLPDAEFVEQAAQTPALPPGWIPAPPAPDAPEAPTATQSDQNDEGNTQ